MSELTPLQQAKRVDVARYVATLEQVAAGIVEAAKIGRAELTGRAAASYREEGDLPTWRMPGLGLISASVTREAAYLRDAGAFARWLIRCGRQAETEASIQVAPQDGERALQILEMAGVRGAVLVRTPRQAYVTAMVKNATDPKKPGVYIDGPPENRQVVTVTAAGEVVPVDGLAVRPAEDEPTLTFRVDQTFKDDVKGAVTGYLAAGRESGAAFAPGYSSLPALAGGNPAPAPTPEPTGPPEAACTVCGRSYSEGSCSPDPNHPGHSYCGQGPAEEPAPDVAPDPRCGACDCPPSIHAGPANRGHCRNCGVVVCRRYRKAS